MKYNIITLILLFFAIPLNGQKVYYYVSDADQSDTFYITFIDNNCYESDSKGNILSFFYSSGMKYKGIVDGKMKYFGPSFYGEAVFLFSADYSRLTIRPIKDNSSKTFTKANGGGKKSSHQILAEETKKVLDGQPSAIISSPGQSTTPSSSSSSNSYNNHGRRKCQSCNGTGLCSHCKGAGGEKKYSYSKGWYWSTCPICNGTGRCGVCHGIGGI